MIIVLKPGSSDSELQEVLRRIEDLGLKAHLSRGVQHTIIGIIGEEEKLRVEPLSVLPGVEQVLPILKPFKLASREFHPENSCVRVGAVPIGCGSLAMIAGPCAIE